jgi:putative spermidine/putrescine transport system ATP-binding protein
VEAYRAPSNAFVANFIGVTNFIEGKVSEVTPTNVTITAAGINLVGVASDENLAVGAACAGAVRAEQIRIASTNGRLEGLSTVVEGKVEDCIFEGERVVYEIRVQALGGVVMRVFDHDPESHLQFAPGDDVRLGWNARDMHIFQK